MFDDANDKTIRMFDIPSAFFFDFGFVPFVCERDLSDSLPKSNRESFNFTDVFTNLFGLGVFCT